MLIQTDNQVNGAQIIYFEIIREKIGIYTFLDYSHSPIGAIIR